MTLAEVHQPLATKMDAEGACDRCGSTNSVRFRITYTHALSMRNQGRRPNNRILELLAPRTRRGPCARCGRTLPVLIRWSEYGQELCVGCIVTLLDELAGGDTQVQFLVWDIVRGVQCAFCPDMIAGSPTLALPGSRSGATSGSIIANWAPAERVHPQCLKLILQTEGLEVLLALS